MKTERGTTNTPKSGSARRQQQTPTVQAKFGNQDAKSMTPDQAAAYLKAITSSGWGTSTSKELKRNNNSNNNNSNAGSSSASGGGSGASSTNNAFNLAFAEANNILRNASSRNGGRVGATNHSSGSSSLPCSEKEMKALMSMFVEIMGLQMNTEKLNRVANSNLFQFPPDLPPPPGGWPSDLWPNEYGYDNPPKKLDDGDGDDDHHHQEEEQDGDSIDSLPELEECELGVENSSLLTAGPPEPVTGKSGIACLDWEALEELAIEDALEQEERARKAAKKRQMNATRTNPSESDRCVHEMEQREAEAEADRKREKTVLTWRSSVASACHANEVHRMEALLMEAPLMKEDSQEFLRPHLEYFVPIILPKNRQLVEKNRPCREKLAEYVFNFSYNVMLVPQQNGRSGLHTCCFCGDLAVVQIILGLVKDSQINAACLESGWTPLHYAAASGSFRTVEALLARGADIQATTSDNLTWLSSNKRGITAKQLLEHVMEGAIEKELETHGMALQEVKKALSFTKHKLYRASLGKILERLKDVEMNGFTPLTKKQINRIEKQITTDEHISTVLANKPAPQNPEVVAPDANLKKNKPPDQPIDPKLSKVETGQKPQEEDERVVNDPVINALLGMGFEKQTIMKGVRASGGLDRATVDDVVAWIVSNQTESDSVCKISQEKKNDSNERTSEAHIMQDLPATQKEDERMQAVRLAAKREEQRRRNREWNLRQREEAQLKASIMAEGKHGRPSAPKVPTRPAPGASQVAHPSSLSQPLLQKGSTPVTTDKKQLPDQRSYDAFETTNESYTVSSSIEIGSIDVGNDDCTVSTLGSHPARSTPVPILPPIGPHATAPPGFAVPPGTEKLPPVHRDMQLNATNSGLLFGGSLQVDPSPGIPESEPLLDARHGLPSYGLDSSLPYRPYANLAATDESGFLERLHPPQSDYESSFFPSIPVAPVNIGRHLEQDRTGPVGLSPSHIGQNVINHNGYGLGNVSLNPAHSGVLEASIIDSISTGNELMPGVPASLWDDVQTSPSLLSNLIPVDDFHDDREDVVGVAAPRSGIDSSTLNGWSQPATTNFTGHGGASIW